jgi:cephalosporin-C deacetylase
MISRILPLVALGSLLLCGASPNAHAQQLKFTPGHATGIYEQNERVSWKAELPEGMPSGPYTYVIKKNNFGAPIKTGTLDLAGGPVEFGIQVDEPCMLFVKVSAPGSGSPNRSQALGAAVAPSRIEPSARRPADFDRFWEGKLAELARVPMNPLMTPGESGRANVEFAIFRLDSLGSNVQGYFAKPKKEGKLPALVIFQWAGVYALQKNAVLDRARQGWLVLNVDSHDKQPSAASGPPGNYASLGFTDRETSYFLKMYLRDTRAIDYLASRPEWDGKTLVVMGTSMGGQQSLCAAGLNPKVTHVIVNEPAGCDITGPLHGRASGYPSWPAGDKAAMATGPYFDAVNFASRIKATALVAMGFVDTVAPPVGIWAAFNQLQGPKESAPMVDSPHNNLATSRQQLPFNRRASEWLNALVKGEPVKVATQEVRQKDQ